MYQGKHFAPKITRKPQKGVGKVGALLLSLLLLTVFAVGGTVAYLVTRTTPVQNTFTPATVSCEVTEDFNGITKSNVNVQNTGDTYAYIRVKLVSYRVNASGQHIGGTATVPGFTPGANWVQNGGYYYYTKPVSAGESPADPLIGNSGITLKTYDDADGGKQVIEVMAEAIQSSPANAVQQSWGVSISAGSVTPNIAGGNE